MIYSLQAGSFIYLSIYLSIDRSWSVTSFRHSCGLELRSVISRAPYKVSQTLCGKCILPPSHNLWCHRPPSVLNLAPATYLSAEDVSEMLQSQGIIINLKAEISSLAMPAWVGFDKDAFDDRIRQVNVHTGRDSSHLSDIFSESDPLLV